MQIIRIKYTTALLIAVSSSTTSSCSKEINTPLGNCTNEIILSAKGDPINGYDIYASTPNNKRNNILIYCTIDRPAYAHLYLKECNKIGKKIILTIKGEEESCGQKIQPQKLGEYQVEINTTN